MKKVVIVLTLTIFGLHSFGQKSLKDIKGDLSFKDSWFYAPITRHFSDTIVIYSTYEKNDSTLITQYVLYSEDNSDDFSYLPFKYSLNSDTLFIKFYNPLTKILVTKPAYSLRKNDTLIGSTCFKFLLDSLNENGKKKYFIDECNSDSDDLKIIYKGDTTFNWNDYSFNCFIFEEQKISENLRASNFKRVILFDKEAMLPIDIKEYIFLKKYTRWYRNIPREKWLFSRHLKLIYVDPD